MIYKKITSYLTILLLITLVMTLTVNADTYSRQSRFNLNGKMEESFTGQATLLYPFNETKDSLFYSDVRGMFSGDDISEWNLGLGYRKKLNERNFIWGTYLFYDNRKELDRYWNQWTLGTELLTGDMDLRFNYYIPQKEKVLAASVPNDSIQVVGNNLLYKKTQLNTYYQVMGGYDLEFGKRFTHDNKILNNLGAYFRVYNFSGNDTATMSGSGFKIDKLFGNPNGVNYKLGIDWQNDNIRGTSTEATFALSIPLGKNTETEINTTEDQLETRMTETPRRDIDVIVGNTIPENKVIEKVKVKDNEDPENEVNIWYVTASGNGTGEKSDPTNLAALKVNTELSKNDIIVLLGNDGVIEADYFNLAPGQKLLSPGGYAIIKVPEYPDREAEFKPEGIRATVSGSEIAFEGEISLQRSFSGLISLGDNTTVSGLIFKNSTNAIYGSDISGDIYITNNKFEMESQTAIEINYSTSEVIEDANNKLLIEKNIIESAGNAGISVINDNRILKSEVIEDEKSKIIINNNIINKADNTGISVINANNNIQIDISNNEIKIIEPDNMFRTGSQNISILVRPNNSGIYVENHGSKNNVNIKNNKIGYSNYAIFAMTQSEQNFIEIRDNIIDTCYSGINISGNLSPTPNSLSMQKSLVNYGTINIINNEIKDAFVTGMAISTGSIDSLIKQNTIDKAGQYGIVLDKSMNSNTIFQENHIKEADYGGILVPDYLEDENIEFIDNIFGADIDPQIDTYEIIDN